MSQADVETVRRWAWAFDNDTDAFCRLTHPDIEWMPYEDNHTPSVGLEGALRIRNAWSDAWDEHAAHIEEILEHDGDVFASVLLTGRGKSSGVGVEVRLYAHFKLRDGAVVYLYEHQDRSAALNAMGLGD